MKNTMEEREQKKETRKVKQQEKRRINRTSTLKKRETKTNKPKSFL
jgi:hypothetical protein